MTGAQGSALPFDFARGEVLLVDKPKGWTSFDVVARLRTLTRCKKIGHAGTLDPLATGLLVVCTGGATKRIAELQEGEKEYVAVCKLGAVTASYDAEQPETDLTDASQVTREQIETALGSFRGAIMQRPPAYSAVKVGGRRAYASARAGQSIELAQRPVTVSELVIEDYAAPLLRLRMRCSKGTYVRSLAHDLGQALGVGAYLAELRRTASGAHRIEEALTLEQLAALLKPHQPAELAPSASASQSSSGIR